MLAVVAAAALVAGAATLFGTELAAEGHGHRDPAEADAHMEEKGHAEEQEGHVEPGGTEAAAAEEGEEGNALVKVGSASLIALGAAALVPIAALAVRRRDPDEPGERRDDPLRFAAALLAAGAAAIHFAVISEHLRVWWAEGAFFVAAATVQLLWALAVVARPTRLLYAVGIAGNAFLVLTWVVSRTVGVPLGPEAGEAEPVGFVDATATAYEIVAIGALSALVLRAAPVGAPSAARVFGRLSWVTGLLLVPLTALALLDLVQL